MNNLIEILIGEQIRTHRAFSLLEKFVSEFFWELKDRHRRYKAFLKLHSTSFIT